MVSGLNYKKISIFIAILFLFVFSINICLADNLINAFNPGGPLDQVAGSKGAGYKTGGEPTVETMISLIITTALSFIGVIFLVLAIYGGYIWMMARGNEQEVEKAKNIIQGAIIGLVVVVAAYAISWYVINALGATTLKEATK